MCKYCNQKPWKRKRKYEDIFDHAILLGWVTPFVGLYLGINEQGQFVLAASGDDESCVHINHCPMCGRQLKEV